MAKENIELTDWTSKEYEADRTWIDENLPVLRNAALSEYDEIGPGAVFIDTREYDEGKNSHPFYYLSQANIEELENEETKQVISEYSPNQELVIVLIKTGERECVYKITMQNE